MKLYISFLFLSFAGFQSLGFQFKESKKHLNFELGLDINFQLAKGKISTCNFYDSLSGYAKPGQSFGINGILTLNQKWFVLARINNFDSKLSQRDLLTGYQNSDTLFNYTIFTEGSWNIIGFGAGLGYTFKNDTSGKVKFQPYVSLGFASGDNLPSIIIHKTDRLNNPIQIWKKKYSQNDILPALALSAGFFIQYNLKRGHNLYVSGLYLYTLQTFLVQYEVSGKADFQRYTTIPIHYLSGGIGYSYCFNSNKKD